MMSKRVMWAGNLVPIPNVILKPPRQDNGPAADVMRCAKVLHSHVRWKKVLKVLVDCDHYDGFGYVSFAYIYKRTKMTRSEVRRACRVLHRYEMAHFSSGLFNLDGGVAGSGYAATHKGRAALRVADAIASDEKVGLQK